MSDKLILICTDVSEPSTDVVCSWLHHYNKKFVRISFENIITIKSVSITNSTIDIQFAIDDIDYNLSDFQSYWYRRSCLSFAAFAPIKYIHDGIDLSSKMNNFLYEEYAKLKEFFKYELNKIAILNKYEDNEINKLKVLSIAKDCGIAISDTYVVENMHSLDFANSRYITKAISDLVIVHDNQNYYCTTERIDEPDNDISFSLVQKEVKKIFEIRSFFFNRQFFSSAIFSQENEKTKLDFRNYDFENPNRVVPFQLPEQMEEKLLALADKIELKCGSFDLAYTNEDEFVLFEVNPVGQFEQVTFPCNYSIHKLIAQAL